MKENLTTGIGTGDTIPAFTESDMAPGRLKRAPRSLLWWLLLALVLLIATGIFLWGSKPYDIDDAPITYRYPDNIVDGNGFDHNQRERIQGASTPLHTLLLAALGFLGVYSPTASSMLNLLGSIALIAATMALAWRLRPSFWTPLLAGVLVLAQGSFLRYSMAGMQTPIYSLLVVSALLAFAYGRTLLSAVLAGLAVLIRHPAAFASSMKRLDWDTPFHHLLDQPLLMKDYLQPFEGEISDYTRVPRGVIDRAILLWRIIYHVVSRFRQIHPDWTFVRHEDLSRDPLAGFRDLYARLGLEYSPQIQAVISEHSDTANLVEVPAEWPFALKRNSRSSIWTWKQRLSQAEIDYVREQTADVASEFYTEDDW